MKAYKLGFYVPETHLTIVKEALFAAGAGKIGNYDSCSWECLGRGQYQPLAGADPFLGSAGKLETVEEFRVEMVCSADRIREAIVALRKAHPYETPAFDVVELVAID